MGFETIKKSVATQAGLAENTAFDLYKRIDKGPGGHQDATYPTELAFDSILQDCQEGGQLFLLRLAGEKRSQVATLRSNHCLICYRLSIARQAQKA
jgi:hypothetical protein